MRLAGIERAGFYATPPIALARIANFLKVERNGITRVLDPCAGEGEAITTVATALRQQGATVHTYATELSYTRADKVEPLVDNFIQGDWKGVAMTAQCIGLLWLNPPYDHELMREGDEKRARLEYRFLQNTRDQLDIGGVLVYIVPLHILQNSRYTHFILNNFSNIRVYRFPEAEYEAYDQVVMFANRRSSRDESPKSFIPEYGLELPPELPPVPDAEYVVPAHRMQAITFRLEILSDEELVARVKTHGAHTTRAFLTKDHRARRNHFQPVVPLKLGHVIGLIGSGQMGDAALGENLVVKGRTYKEIDVSIKSLNEETGDATTVEKIASSPPSPPSPAAAKSSASPRPS